MEIKEEPLVSFIIPFYNSASTILDAIDSIEKQNYTHYDVWIVDDGSTHEPSLRILNELTEKEKIHVIRQENQGPSLARQAAIEKTKAEFLVLLDADNRIRPETIEMGLAILQSNKEIGVVYGDLYYFTEEKNWIKKQEEFSIKKALLYNQVDTACVIKKEVFKKTGSFDSYMSKIGLEDWEFWINITEDGWKMVHIPAILFDIRVRKDSRTYETANPNLQKLMVHVYKKHAETVIREYKNLYYEEKMLRETPDYRIGQLILKPWRFLKSILKK